MAVFRDNNGSGFLHRAFSTDDGRTWSPPVKTNFPDATSKISGLRLSDGCYVLVANPRPRKRDPLTLSISDDGMVFTKMIHLASGRWIDYRYDPKDPVPTLWSENMFTLPADQAPLAKRADILVYQSEPLTAPMEVTGYPEVILHAASSAPDTDFFAKLIDVAPDGANRDIASGMVRARYRDELDKPKLLAPGEVVEYRIKLRPTSNEFQPGHRIRLDITSSDFPNYDRNHNTAADQNADAKLEVAAQTVYHGGVKASRLILPVITTTNNP